MISRKIPIIAVGNKVFEALPYRFPNRLIIEVPHPTGSYGNFRKLFGKSWKIKKQFLKIARETKDKEGNLEFDKIVPKMTVVSHVLLNLFFSLRRDKVTRTYVVK